MTKDDLTAAGGKAFVRLGGGEATVEELLRDDPPEYENDFKREIYEEAYEEFAERQSGVVIRFSRHACVALSEIPVRADRLREPEIVPVPYFFRYDDAHSDAEKCWYLNFADPQLFYAYDSDLFAQDEIQTLEHPLLASVALRAAATRDPGLRPLTVEKCCSTPWIFENVPRWIRVDTAPVDENGQTRSIYGNAFPRAERSLLRRAITVVDDQEARSNVIAMAAPRPGYGEYRPDQIIQLLDAALGGFAPAVDAGAGKRTVIHTGRWGAGAFGGSEELALCVQIVGGMLCGVTKLYFHAVSGECLENALATAREVVAASADAEDIVRKLAARKYRWGCSDGN